MTRSNAADAAVLAAAAPTMLLLLIDPHGPGGALLTLMGLAGATGVAVMVRCTGALPGVLWPVVGLLTLVAVARAPLGSRDIWSSAFYGRVVARYGADPYASVAKSYPGDLVYPLVGWRNTPSAYGPLFTAYSAVVARMSGTVASLAAVRLPAAGRGLRRGSPPGAGTNRAGGHRGAFGAPALHLGDAGQRRERRRADGLRPAVARISDECLPRDGATTRASFRPCCWWCSCVGSARK